MDRVISFDLDGTLINGPFPQVLTDLGDELDRRHGTAGAKREILRRHQRLLGSDLLAAYDWQSIAAGYVEELGVALPFELLGRLDRYARDGAMTVLHADTAAQFDRLRSAGWHVAILTNGWRRYQEPVLRHSGLLAAIDAIVTSDDVGCAKPAGPIFAAARAGAAEHVHVGDRIDHDVIGGNAAGARTVLLRTDAPADPAALPDYLARLAAAQGVTDPDPGLAAPELITARLADLVDRLGSGLSRPREAQADAADGAGSRPSSISQASASRTASQPE